MAFISCILFNSTAFGENDTYIPIHIDGFNTVLFNQEYPHKSLNMYSIIYGNPLDRFPLSQLSYFPDITFSNYDSIKNLGKDSLFRLQASGAVGSEYGEPMLNELEGIYNENRDHFTTFAAACNIPRTPAHVFFSYRYTDNYSDNFEKSWAHYKKETGKNMPFSEEGLAYEIASGYTLFGPIATTSLKAVSYKQWGTSPYYFSPIYRTGYALNPTLAFSLPKSKLWIDLLFDYNKNYYDRVYSTEYTDEGWNIKWQRKLHNGIIAQFNHHKDSKLRPSSYANACLHDTIPNLLIWNVSGNLYSNLRMGGYIDIQYIQIPKISLNVKPAWEYIPKTRSFRSSEGSDWYLEYHALQYEVVTLHTALSYTDTIFHFPAKASVWLNYCEKPIWEILDYRPGGIIIRQDTIKNSAHLTFGGKGSYKITLFNKLLVSLWGNASLTPKNKEISFSLPLNVGADITFGKPNNDSLYAEIKFEYRDQALLKYRTTSNNIKDFIAPAQTSAYLFLKMPFHFPLFREHLRTSLQVGAGPLRFSREQRILEHPKGNLIGPTISFGVNGFIN